MFIPFKAIDAVLYLVGPALLGFGIAWGTVRLDAYEWGYARRLMSCGIGLVLLLILWIYALMVGLTPATSGERALVNAVRASYSENLEVRAALKAVDESRYLSSGDARRIAEAALPKSGDSTK